MIRHRRLVLALVASLVLFTLAGCQFPGAGVSVSFTSPTPREGARITGVPHPYSLAVTVKVSGATPDSFALTNNGKNVTGVTPSGQTYSASVPLDDGENVLVAKATAAGFTYTDTRHVYYPFLAFTSGQNAGMVMGETSFTFAPGAQRTAIDELYLPQGAAALVGGNYYIPDTGNNRVVGYTSLPSSPTGADFNILLGKPAGTWTYGDPPSTTNASTLSLPAGVGGTASQLIVADTADSRVLVWAGTPTTIASSPLAFVGQTGPTGTLGSCTRTGLDHPAAAFAVGTKLIVADTGNNRVMIWNSIPSTSGKNADLELGQPDFSTCAAGSTSGSTLSEPSGVWSDGTKLLVADTGNNRVLIWKTFPTSNGEPADTVIGQADMNGNTAQPPDAPSSTTVKTGLAGPHGVSSNGNQIFIADTGNNRVVVFDAFPIDDGAHADRVLGQGSLGSVAPNGGNPAPGASTLDGPWDVGAFDGFVIVADTNNSRELLFRPPATP